MGGVRARVHVGVSVLCRYNETSCSVHSPVEYEHKMNVCVCVRVGHVYVTCSSYRVLVLAIITIVTGCTCEIQHQDTSVLSTGIVHVCMYWRRS